MSILYIRQKHAKILLAFAFLFLAGLPLVLAQIEISGTITDENQDPLPGANVIVKGSTSGTVADLEGNFNLTVPNADAILIFSYTGYATQEIPVGSQTVFNLTLRSDIARLGEIVVTGYGTQREKSITGAVSVVDVEDLNNSQYTNLTDRLQGRVAGVTVTTTGEPGARGDIKIRGTSFFGDNNPLYVIDGVLTDDSPNLNPADVESIQVLKDASSAAIYGSRAANGVVVITTKKGTRGKPQVTVSANFGIQNLPKDVEMADNFRWAEIINAARDNAGLPRPTKADTDFDPAVNTDWKGAVFNENALLQDFNVGVSAGGENSRIYFNLNNTYQEGVVEGPLFDRIGIRLNSEFELWGRLKVGENLTISRVRNSGLNEYIGVSPISGAYQSLPVIPVFDPLQPSGYGIGVIGVAESFIANPIGVRDEFKNISENTRILGNVYLDLEIIEGLNYYFSLGIDSDFGFNKSFNRAVTIRMSDIPLSSLSEGRSESTSLFIENRLTYGRTFGKHTFSITGVYQEQEINGADQNTSFEGGFDGDDPFFQISQATVPPIATGGEFSSAIRSILGRATYSFDDRYFFTGILRYDGSSKFAEENRWGLFPSVSAGWNLANEPFFNVPIISDLKFRAGYGEVGNASIGDYQFQSGILSQATGGVNYDLGPSSTPTIGATRGAIVNRDITWETLKETNLGIDLEMFEGKLFATADYYFGNLEDLLTEVNVPRTIGSFDTEAPTINAVSMERRGWEVTFGWRDYDKKFKYSISGNLFQTKNEITQLPFGVNEFFGGLSVSRLGIPLGQLFLVEYLGIYTSQEQIDADGVTINGRTPVVGDARYRDVNGRDENGQLTGQPDGNVNFDDDRILAGDPTPRLQYGFTFTAEYLGFDLSIFFQGLAGRDVYGSFYEGLNQDQTSNYTADYDPYINGSGTEPRPIANADSGNSFPSTRFVESGSFFRLKNLQLGYTVPFKKVVRNMRLYVAGQNIFTIADYRGLDPEFEGGVFDPGVDPGGYPNIRTFSAGFNVTFQ